MIYDALNLAVSVRADIVSWKATNLLQTWGSYLYGMSSVADIILLGDVLELRMT